MIGLKKSKALAKELVDDALKALEIFDNKADPLREIATYIINRDK
jgi:geranylgeranyl diphosphate synthase type II